MTISLFSTFNSPATSSRVTGTTASNTPSSVTANKLVDTANSFSNVSIGDYVVLQENPKVFTTVTALDSATQLSLADDIITSLTDYYFVVTAATAFKIVRDNSGGENLNYQVLVSPGDLVDSDDTENINYTLSGCRVVSVDSVGELTVDLPLGGHNNVVIGMQGSLDAFDLSGVDVFYKSVIGEDVALTSIAGPAGSFASVYGHGLNQAATLQTILSDIEEAIVKSAGGAWKTNAPVNLRAIGAQTWDI